MTVFGRTRSCSRSCQTVAMLPGAVNGEADDGILVLGDDERIPPQPLDPEWYEMKYTGDMDEAGGTQRS